MSVYDDPNKHDDPVLKATGWHHPIIAQPQVAKYAITGKETQVVTFALDVGESVQGEPGVMMYLTPGMSQTVSCAGCCARSCSGESCWVVNFTNSGSHGSSVAYAALTTTFPTAKVIPVNLTDPNVNGSLICQQSAYMAGLGDVQVGVSLDFNCLRCCCAGTGLVRQKITGSGTVFLNTSGTIVQKVLEPGETIVIDTNSILAFSESCKLDLQRTGGILGMVGGGEGIFNTTLTGPGLAILQSMNEHVFRRAIAAEKIWRR